MPAAVVGAALELAAPWMPVPVPLLLTRVTAGASPVSTRMSPLWRAKLARARRLSPASMSQSPSKTRLPARPRSARASLPPAVKACAQAIGRPLSRPRDCSRCAAGALSRVVWL